eukprot:7991244-Lingulodinium_polyedra.AAC.1
MAPKRPRSSGSARQAARAASAKARVVVRRGPRPAMAWRAPRRPARQRAFSRALGSRALSGSSSLDRGTGLGGLSSAAGAARGSGRNFSSPAAAIVAQASTSPSEYSAASAVDHPPKPRATWQSSAASCPQLQECVSGTHRQRRCSSWSERPWTQKSMR